MGWPLLAITILPSCLLWPTYYCAVAIVPAVLFGLVVYFFRDPPRRVPAEAGLIVSPADGKIAEITRLDHDEFIGGPAVRIGIFLSIFNVHINRAPVESRVIELRYNPGRVPQRAAGPTARGGTKTRGSAWKKSRRRIGG